MIQFFRIVGMGLINKNFGPGKIQIWNKNKGLFHIFPAQQLQLAWRFEGAKAREVDVNFENLWKETEK